ncbi:hypothetical protein [Mesoterricola sediminis]|uniref:DUF1579 domain-containing protein n=1 Tax=Mesoterricola sediminis TaxID=2927980 RepID=A0AA48KB06_9BACT|nr:hypothetical protein [Mesoterricola sediminis]BDU75619.1 hypothetical protein METESE_05770 [Mesoterricola sediminis]
MKRLALSFLCGTLAAQTPDPLAPLRSLAGAWVGEGGGDPGQGEGAFTFTSRLGGRVLVRESWSAYPAQGGRPAFRHEDLMTVYAEGGALKALYWDNEGHTIPYEVAAGPDRITFTSPAGQGPRFRLTYRLTAPDRVHVAFAIAPPGQPEAFRVYVEGDSRRR